MTDQLNEAGIEAAANQIHMMLAVNIQHAQSIARAAITAYLECAGAKDPMRSALWSSVTPADPSKYATWRIDPNATEYVYAPTPETREPSEEAITEAMNKNRRDFKDPRDGRNRMSDALRAAYAIDFPSAPKAPSEDAMRAALEPFRSGGVWGKVKAWIIGKGFQEEGTKIAKQITHWQTAVDAALATAPNASKKGTQNTDETLHGGFVDDDLLDRAADANKKERMK